MTAEVLYGWALVVAAAWPALSPKIRTGVISTLGLFSMALAGMAFIAGRGDGTREWLIVGGLMMVAAAHAIRMMHATSRAKSRTGSKHAPSKPAGHRLHGD